MKGDRSFRQILSDVEVNLQRISQVIHETYFMLICFAILVAFCIGLLLGGKIIAAKQRPLEQKMEETREELKRHPSSVILIGGDIADAVGFKLRKYDLDMREDK